MSVQRHEISLVTDGAGACTAYSAYPVSGEIKAVVYVRGTLDNTTTDITITGEKSGISILALTNVTTDGQYAPRMATHGITGTAALYAAAGTAVLACIPVALERIQVVVAQGGASKTGTLHVYVES